MSSSCITGGAGSSPASIARSSSRPPRRPDLRGVARRVRPGEGAAPRLGVCVCVMDPASQRLLGLSTRLRVDVMSTRPAALDWSIDNCTIARAMEILGERWTVRRAARGLQRHPAVRRHAGAHRHPAAGARQPARHARRAAACCAGSPTASRAPGSATSTGSPGWASTCGRCWSRSSAGATATSPTPRARRCPPSTVAAGPRCACPALRRRARDRLAARRVPPGPGAGRRDSATSVAGPSRRGTVRSMSVADPPAPAPSRPAPAPAWAPLRVAVFRALWLAMLASNIGTWMQTVGAQWLLVDEPERGHPGRARADRAACCRSLLLALPAGALADIVRPAPDADRRPGLHVRGRRWR